MPLDTGNQGASLLTDHLQGWAPSSALTLLRRLSEGFQSRVETGPLSIQIGKPAQFGQTTSPLASPSFVGGTNNILNNPLYVETGAPIYNFYEVPREALQPQGGEVGQILVKVDDSDYNSEWATPSTPATITTATSTANATPPNEVRVLNLVRDVRVQGNSLVKDKSELWLNLTKTDAGTLITLTLRASEQNREDNQTIITFADCASRSEGDVFAGPALDAYLIVTGGALLFTDSGDVLQGTDDGALTASSSSSTTDLFSNALLSSSENFLLGIDGNPLTSFYLASQEILDILYYNDEGRVLFDNDTLLLTTV